jgi:hypothetical protein
MANLKKLNATRTETKTMAVGRYRSKEMPAKLLCPPYTLSNSNLNDFFAVSVEASRSMSRKL